MKKIHILIALVGLLALAAVPAASQVAVPSGAHQWEVHNADGVSFATAYELYNQKNGSQIGYEKRTFGVDLGWVGHSGGHFMFMRWAPVRVRDHRPGPIAENENVAIFNTKTNRYLMYYKRGDAEAELEWSSTPVYEWQVRDQKGTSVASFALFNDRVDKYLVYQFKNYGINLGWLNDTPPAPQSFSVALSAQQVNQGWVPYAGSFGQNTKGNLLTVQNASQSATLLFVKPGKSTNDCSDPNATVRVAPRATMTADQMKTLYGSATPRLAVNFLACLTTPTPQSISLTFLNITYKLDP
jgi:hypothetical protein